MEDQQDLMVEGVTAFAPSPAASYRYVIELKGSKMSIRMEDRTSKKQWYVQVVKRSKTKLQE
ncbi:hypothetical protein PF006_g18653 [Phytophthora fragariae]|uniref:Uncharacterized protein n=1 Tax=Phytophthora fragariae TaxID=53985 RepID=A0A6A3SIZ0_9STRA|nr:hypothetical protein PF006_g18653 [Phytophthora fragariae]